MGNSVYGIGISGLMAAQAGLVTTGHNIANANTPGYHRQRIEQSTAIPQYTGDGFFGQGTDVDTVVRSYSTYLDSQLREVDARSSYLNAYLGEVRQLDDMMADPNAGLSPALQDFFHAVHDVASSPSSVPARQSVLSAGQTLAARFQSLESRLNDVLNGVGQQIESAITNVNTYAREIASLNDQIIKAQAAGSSAQPANDLHDQRDQLIAELNQIANTTIAEQGDGSINVMIGNGQNLVVGARFISLVEARALEEPSRVEVGYDVGGTVANISSSLQGGQLGGLLAFRNEIAEPALNQLGRVAIVLAATFNDQHSLGQDLYGAAGGAFFAVPAPTVSSKTTNAGSGVLAATITGAGSLTGSDYRVSYAGGNYTVTRLADNVSQSFAALPQTVDGVAISLQSGTPANGDSFLIQPTRTGARNLRVALTDGARFAAAAPIRTGTGAANTGTATISAGSVNTPPPPNANLTQAVTITFTSPTTFNVTGTGTGNPVGVAYTPGAPVTYNGWTVTLQGAPASGDVFTIGANVNGIADNRNALALASLQTSATVASGTATYQGAYSQTVNMIGNKAREMEVTSRAQGALVEHTKQAQQSLSGVNLDEEAANLIRYQQAYQASGKMIEIASRLFDDLLRLGG